MNIVVNGEARTVSDKWSIRELVAELPHRGPVAIEVNGEVLPRSQHNALLKPGDRVEIVTFVGGG